MTARTLKCCATTLVALGIASTALIGCGAAASPAPIHHAATHHAAPKPTAVAASIRCAGLVTVGRADVGAARRSASGLTSAPCSKAMAIIPTGASIAWLARPHSAAGTGAHVTLRVTRISGPGQHPLVVYSSRVWSTGKQTLLGTLTTRQMRAAKITPAVYAVAIAGGSGVLATGSFQLGNPAQGMMGAGTY